MKIISNKLLFPMNLPLNIITEEITEAGNRRLVVVANDSSTLFPIYTLLEKKSIITVYGNNNFLPTP